MSLVGEGDKRGVELLAPAGSMEAFRAALYAGADAVYLGAGSFNARRNAANFDMRSLEAAVKEAHLARSRIYLALNTLVAHDEMEKALDLAKAALNAGVDAFIVQDLGLLSALHEAAPECEIHISTQLNAIDAYCAKTARLLGASRLTLGRELALSEIKAISDEGMETEVFAHGALCVCYSGQCLMSSMIGSRSANRGLCAQPCRLPFELGVVHGGGVFEELDTPGRHLLSPKDLCTIDVLPQLIEAGVCSLKIEGRMKSAEYVACVTSVYRAALDRALEDPQGYEVGEDEHRLLQEAFSRGFTTGYMQNARFKELMSYQRPNNRGVSVGRVERVEAGVARISLTCEVKAGDVLDFWTRKGHVTLTLEKFSCNGKPADKALAGQEICVAVRAVRPSDRVFRVRSRELAERFSALPPVPNRPGRRLDFKVDAHLGKALEMQVCDDTGQSASVKGQVCQAARTKEISADEICEHVGRIGGSPYVMGSCDVSLGEGIGMGFSSIHRLRAEAMEELQQQILSSNSRPAWKDPLQNPLLSLEPRERRSPKTALITQNGKTAAKALRMGAEVYVPACACESIEDADRCFCLLPTVIHEEEYPSLIKTALRCKGAVADSVWSLARFVSEDVDTQAGPRCNVLNSTSASVLQELGASGLWISPEMTLAQIKTLSKMSGLPLTLVVRGRQELMITEQCQCGALGECSRICPSCGRRGKSLALRDRMGYVFPVKTDEHGRGHIYNSVSLDAVPQCAELSGIVECFVVDGTLMDDYQATTELERLTEALKPGAQPPVKASGATTGHLFRPLS